jgi:hypothetical protein
VIILGECRNPCCRAVLRPRAAGRGYDGACGYCRPCYTRWTRSDRPETGPPPPLTFAEAAAIAAERRSEERAARLEDYGWLRLEQDETLIAAAKRVGVSPVTAYKYEREIGVAA